MQQKQADAQGRTRRRSPMEPAWILAGLLIVGLESYLNPVTGPFLDSDSVVPVYPLAALAVGLGILLPAHPPAPAWRWVVYLVPVAGVSVLFLLDPERAFAIPAMAWTVPWAMLTAFYGTRLGLPRGLQFVPGYALAWILPSVAAGFMLFVAGGFVFLLPLLPLGFLLWPDYRRHRARSAVELLLAAALAVCIWAQFEFFPTVDSWFGYHDIAGARFLASLFIVLALVAMAYYARFDTGEYPPKSKAAHGGNPEKAQRPR